MRRVQDHGGGLSGCVGSGWRLRAILRCPVPGTAEARRLAGIVRMQRPEPVPASCPDVQPGRPGTRYELSAMVAVEIGGGDGSQRF
jgi:hypothetical protein